MKIYLSAFSTLVLKFNLCLCQPIPVSNGLHRVVMARADTVFEFYAQIPDVKMKTQEDKIYAWYKPDTILFTKGSCSGRILNGLYKEYFPGKNLKVAGQFHDGLRDGKWMWWSENGELKQAQFWKMGWKEGRATSYDNNGIKTAEMLYKHDVLQGRQLQYNETKKAFDTLYFKNGVRKTSDSIHKELKQPT